MSESGLHGGTGEAGASAEPQPLIHVTAGHPTAEEIAAISTVLLSHARAAPQAPPARPRSVWADRQRMLAATAMPDHGPQGWRRSALPR